MFVDYFIALNMTRANENYKKKLLYISLFVNLGLLFYFKYLIFFAESAIGLADILGMQVDPIFWNIVLPLGISFYTFQTISYTIDVYRGHAKAQKNFLLYACYVTYFPQLVAGPILRINEVVKQFEHRPKFHWQDIEIGIRRIIYGLFLKVVLADNLAPLVDSGFSMDSESLSAIDVWTLSFLFGFQIYFDFCAYSHIALGSARLMGIKFPENFNFPYSASSPRDFWKRWHISLSSWIRDYLYLPIVGAKVQDKSTGGLEVALTGIRKTKALFLTWAIMGLWHGANWTFIVWGLYHAVVISVYRGISSLKIEFLQKVNRLIFVLITLPAMMLSWIPFRAESLDVTFEMWSMVFNPYKYNSLGLRENLYLVATILTVGVLFASFVNSKIKCIASDESYTIKVGGILIYSIALPLIFIFFRPINQFIYFQF